MPREKPLRLALLPTLDSLEDKAFAGESFSSRCFQRTTLEIMAVRLKSKYIPVGELHQMLTWFHYIGNLVWVPFGHLFLLSQVIISLQSPPDLGHCDDGKSS